PAASHRSRADHSCAAYGMRKSCLHRSRQVCGGDDMRANEIINAVESVTKKWAKQRKAEERTRRASENRRNAMLSRGHVSIKDAAWRVMRDAYLKASANDTLPAHARQIMYAARPYVIKNADRAIGTTFDVYFTQTLLPDYIEQMGVNWNVVFDARGHF